MPATGPRTDALLAAALAVLAERPYQEFGYAAVAERAGIEVEQLRHRWAHPAELAVEALVEALGPPGSEPSDAGLRAELLTVTTRLAHEFAVYGQALVGLLAALRHHPELDRAFRERFLLPRTECARRALGRATLRGEIRPEADPRLVLSLVPALFTFRVLLRDPTPDERLAERLVDAVLMPLLSRGGTR
ncbi:regulatory protein, tetR family [Thermomonospora echinospora]|uniref:Regulatory protein, tetR family n=1 Tax=Thermomonospora echinospora TaxID=1992 RepID=A0A1H5SWS9_9ACTN|nr:TetR-like C-terminal domain-containing protein [Thermomonospora echinospora]SEF54301.1 regulatory protein, tetR family [Thermomonospora echinospora]